MEHNIVLFCLFILLARSSVVLSFDQGRFGTAHGKQAFCDQEYTNRAIGMKDVANPLVMVTVKANQEVGIIQKCSNVTCYDRQVPDPNAGFVYMCEDMRTTGVIYNATIGSVGTSKRDFPPYFTMINANDYPCSIWFSSDTEARLTGTAEQSVIVNRGSTYYTVNCTDVKNWHGTTDGQTILATGYCSIPLNFSAQDLATGNYIYISAYTGGHSGIYPAPDCVNNKWSPAHTTCDLFGGIVCCPKSQFICYCLYNFDTVTIIVVLAIVLYLLYTGSMWIILFYLLRCAIGFLRFGVHMGGSMIPKRSSPKTTGTKTIRAVALVILMPVMWACDVSYVASSTFNNCVYNGGDTKICTIKMDTQVTLPYKGTEACVTLMDNASKPIMDIKIKYNDLYSLYATQLEYYTFDWWLDTAQRFRCYGADTCGMGNCDVIQPGDSIAYEVGDAFGIIDDYPGVSMCESGGQGGWGDSCFVVADTCVYSRYALVAQGNPYAVFTVTGGIYQPNVTMTFGSQTNTHVLSSTLTPFSTGDMAGSSAYMAIVGTYNADITYFGDKKVIIGNSKAYVGTATSSGNKACGVIGDYQCFGSSSDVINPWYSFKDQCSYNPSCITSSIASHVKTWAYSPAGIKNIGNYPTLPMVIGPSYLSYTNDALTGVQLNPPAVVVEIRTDRLTLELDQTTVCPEGTFSELGGNIDSGSPAWAHFSMHSTCGKGIIGVSWTGVQGMSSSVSLETIYTEVTLLFLSSNTTVSGTVTFHGVQDVTIAFQGILIENTTKLVTSDYVSTVLQHPLFNIPSVGSVLTTIINYLIIFLVIGALIAIIVFAIKCANSRKVKKN